ncbi:CoA transferase [Verticiella sediminum]|uniref:CoA transferase n=2 Tax=Verticiella sediminum TaxID=1247510 RepID=A0A556ACZ1_9BURK|nr:CoA transferase [Verticiella sediminum]
MGPYATQILAEYGANVIKLEPPEGDIMRGMGPMREPAMGPVFLNLNRGKRSLCLDLRTPRGQRVLARAVERADVFVTNMRPKALRKLGLDSESIGRRNPEIIQVRLTGFGENGPYAGKPAYDDLIQGMAAIPALVEAAGSAAPRYVPLNLADRTVGLVAAHNILAAVLQRLRHGGGQDIEIPMFETMAAFVLGDHLAGRSFVPPLGEAGNPRLLSAYRRPYRTADGWLSAIIYTDAHWQRFLATAGDAERWETDARFHSMTSRSAHIDALYAYVDERFRQRGTDDWLRRLVDCDIPVARLVSLDDLLDDPQLQASGILQTYAAADGPRLGIQPAARWAHAQPCAGACAPRLGEHSAQILAELGLDADEDG